MNIVSRLLTKLSKPSSPTLAQTTEVKSSVHATSDEKTLRLTFVVSGAISLGAYEAGAISQIVYAIDLWNQQRTLAGKPLLAMIDVISGASAGSMTGATLFSHVVRGDSPQDFVRSNYASWCCKTLTGANFTTNELTPHSLFSTQIIDDRANNIIPDNPVYGSGMPTPQTECLFTCTLTSMDGLPFNIAANAVVTNGDMVDVNASTFHDWITFRSMNGQGSSLEELPDRADWQSHIESSDWTRLRQSATASGAVPVVFEPMKITREKTDYTPELTTKTNKLQPRYVDGGWLDNMPLDRASEVLAYLDDPAPDANRIHMLVIPDATVEQGDFSKEPVPGTDGRDTVTSAAKVIGCAWNASRDQSFFHDLYNAQKMNERIELRDELAVELTSKAASTFESNPVELQKEISKREDDLKAMIGATTPDDLERCLNAYKDAVDADSRAGRPRPGRIHRRYESGETSTGVERLRLLYLALFDQAADLTDRSIITIGLIQPDPTTNLAGSQFAHFGGFVTPELMVHDFAAGLKDALKWLKMFTAKYNANEAVPDVMADSALAPLFQDYVNYDFTKSPWPSVPSKTWEVFKDDVIDRGVDFVFSEAGVTNWFVLKVIKPIVASWMRQKIPLNKPK